MTTRVRGRGGGRGGSRGESEGGVDRQVTRPRTRWRGPLLINGQGSEEEGGKKSLFRSVVSFLSIYPSAENGRECWLLDKHSPPLSEGWLAGLFLVFGVGKGNCGVTG